LKIFWNVAPPQGSLEEIKDDLKLYRRELDEIKIRKGELKSLIDKALDQEWRLEKDVLVANVAKLWFYVKFAISIFVVNVSNNMECILFIIINPFCGIQ
jgi:hypothetical protein